jgi:ComF family protein
MGINQIKAFLLDIFFPKICLNCQREGDYLCPDCLSTLEILNFHQKHSTRNLTDLYFALPYQNINTKRLIQKFKYQPFIRELAKTLASLIIAHFQLSDNGENFSDFTLIPVPLGKKRLRWRGFNQAEEIGKKLSLYFKMPLLRGALIKIKETQPQVELAAEARKENLNGVFSVKNKEAIANKKIILVDDVYTTGSTMEECARILKKARAKEIIGIVVARAKPEEDYFQNAN